MHFIMEVQLIDGDAILGKLLPAWPDLLAQLIATFILFLFIKKFVWEKFKNYLDQRSKFIETQISDAKNTNLEANLQLEEAKKEYIKASKEYKEIVDRARVDAIVVKERIEAEAKQQALLKLEQADQEIELEKQRLQEQIKVEIVDVALEAAKRVLEREIDVATHKDLINEFIDEVKH